VSFLFPHSEWDLRDMAVCEIVKLGSAIAPTWQNTHTVININTTPHGMPFQTPHPTHNFVRNHTPRGAAL
jgi:hypothetical protein